MTEFVKIEFPLEPDEDGYPPVGSETLNARASGGGGFILENTPFFVTGVALGDRVAAQPQREEGRMSFSLVLEESSAKAVSIIFLSGQVKEVVYQTLRTRGCYCEYGKFGDLEMLAVSIPPDCDYEDIFAYLSALEEQGKLSFAELAV